MHNVAYKPTITMSLYTCYKVMLATSISHYALAVLSLTDTTLLRERELHVSFLPKGMRLCPSCTKISDTKVPAVFILQMQCLTNCATDVTLHTDIHTYIHKKNFLQGPLGPWFDTAMTILAIL